MKCTTLTENSPKFDSRSTSEKFGKHFDYPFLRSNKCTSQKHIVIYHTLTYLLTYLTPWSRILLDKLTGSQLLKKFPAFYGIRRFITAFTTVCQLSVSWSRSIQSISLHPTFWRFVLILSSYVRLNLPSCLFLSDFPTKTLNTPLLSPHTRCMPRPSHFFLDFITRTILGEHEAQVVHIHRGNYSRLGQCSLHWALHSGQISVNSR